MATEQYQRGCSLFVDEDYTGAHEAFTAALNADSSSTSAQDYYVKRSTCAHKLGKFTEAVADANAAIALNANHAKAYFRKGVACFSLEEYETAKAAFVKGKELDPQDNAFQLWIRKCDAELDDEEEQATTPTTTIPVPTATTSTPTPTAAPTPTPETAPEKVDPTPAPTVPKPDAVRHSWYQNATHVFVTFYVRDRKQTDLRVDFQSQALEVSINLDDGRTFAFETSLFGTVEPAECRTTINKPNIEVKLKKTTTLQWPSLEKKEHILAAASATVEPVAENAKRIYPSSSKNKKDWDQIGATVDEDKLEGEQALNKVFQDIFSKGSEDQRRAMMKSFVESGGTVLSTNWQDVGKGEVKGSAPKGMEMRTWTDK